MNSKYFKELYSKLRKDKKTFAILIMGMAGILLILLSGSGGNEKESVPSDFQQLLVKSEAEMSESLEKLIENIEGAGKAEVMLTFESYGETVYAHNNEENFSPDGETDYMKEYIIIDGNNGENGLKLKVTAPEIKGVAVICQGGKNPVIKEQIVSVVSALFNISSNKISVAAMAK